MLNTLLKYQIMLALLCALAPQSVFAQTAIIEKGASKATIYLNANAPSTVQQAAIDLQSHLKQITDVEIPISSDAGQLKGFVIYLGDTDFARKQGIDTTKFGPDGFRILSTKDWMVIAGKDYNGPVMTGFENPFRINESYSSKFKFGAFGDAGTMFGVYHFLEEYCGVRWYMPGPLGTVIPRKNEISVPTINLNKAPVFQQRHCYYGFMDRSDDDTLWYRRAGYGSPAPVLVQHSFGPFFYKYKDTHPEYFAIIDGQRDFTNLSTAENFGNLNLSNLGLIQQAIEDANKYFDDNPEQLIFPLCPSDGMVKISEDPESQAQIDKSQGPTGEHSNYVWGFINKVAKGIQQKHPDKFIGGFAYEHYAMPPSNIDHLEPNVVVVITKMRAKNYNDAETKQQIQQKILNWKKKVDVIYSWEYYCNTIFNPSWGGYPMFFPKVMQEDMKFLNGISRGEFIEAESWRPEQYKTAPEKIKINYPGVDHLLLYTTARLLWNPDLDMAAMLGEYYKLFYGPSEKPMRDFWETVATTWNMKGWHNNPGQVYDSATINKLLLILDEAKAKAAPDSVYRQRIDLIYSEFSPASQIAERLAKLKKPATDVLALKTPPELADGKPLPALTPGAPVLTYFDRNQNAASPATNVQVAWDETNFYLDLRCYEPNMAKLKTLATARDSAKPAVWEDDGVEIFIIPEAADPTNPARAVHYILTAGGALYDSRINSADKRDNPGWNGNAKVVVRKEANRWIARMAIPWKDLGVGDPKAGQTLSANFYRTRYAGGELIESGWAPLRDASYYSPDDFGTLTLQDKTADSPVMKNPASIQPAGAKDYGSGASRFGMYYEGGIPNAGLFVGHANGTPRDDRALFKFDLTPLLEMEDKIENVNLEFSPHLIMGKKTERQINIRYFPQTVGALDAEILGTGDTESLATLTLTQADTYNASYQNKTELVPQRVDVTAVVKKAISQGQTSMTFRLQDDQAEKEGNTELAPTGLVLSQAGTGGLPSLSVRLK